MASNYTGNPAGGANLGSSSAPGPGVEPTVSVPADTDPNNSATMFAQQCPTLADYVAYIQRSVRLMNPQTAVGGAFSAVTTNALGGTVTPSGTPSPLYDKWLIKIQTGGAVGTATFKTSIDGGTTFGALQTTAASMTDATTGITLAFSGTFTANGTAAFRNAILPMAMWQDSAGNVRHLIDHNGFPVGRRSEFREEWYIPGNNPITSTGTLTAASRWYATLVGASAQFAPSGSGMPGGGGNGFYVTMDPGLTLNGKSAVSTNTVGAGSNQYGLSVASNMSLVMETEFQYPSSDTQTVIIGFVNTQDPWASTYYAYFSKTVSQSTWFFNWAQGGANTAVNTNVSGTSGATQRIRIEIHGGTTAIGAANGGNATLLAFMNESPVAVTTNSSPTFYTGYLCAGVTNTTALGGGTRPIYVGPFFMTWNRQASLPAL